VGRYPVENLKMLFTEDKILFDEPMALHTTFKIGGKADAVVYAENGEELKVAVSYAKDNAIPYVVLGFGSNILVSDKGLPGIVIIMKNAGYMPEIEPLADGRGKALVPAGASLSAFAKAAAKAGYKGTEFAAGIPGSIGGAVAMNAGAYGGEIKDIISSATVLTKELEILELSKEELDLSYRNSKILREGLFVISAEFIFDKGDAKESLAIIADLNQRRRDKQPLEYPSAGSTFKRPVGYFAGKLIDDAGLRGFTVGGAQISEKHCGFVINKSEATSEDVFKLIEEVRKKIYEQFGVCLETEVRMLGEFPY
jgi:UDP-N-acetylmuramate dehydrogenase